MRDFTAGLFPDQQARDLKTRYATQSQTLLIDKHGNKSFALQLKRNMDVVNLLLSFNFLLFTYPGMHISLKNIILIIITIIKNVCI